MDFKLVSDYKPAGDQPEAIELLLRNIRSGAKHNTLHGITGSGKTFTMANVIAELNRPTLVLSHNKTLAAQLYSEFKSFFPQNAVEYFVSYYDYYQPEAYIPSTDTYIEKDLSINKEIDRMRLSATHALLSGRRDVIVVASVSCIYGIGNPDDIAQNRVTLTVGDMCQPQHLMYKLVELLYTRVATELEPATFRVMGDTIIFAPAVGEVAYRVSFFDKNIESIDMLNPETGEFLGSVETVDILPTNIFVPNKRYLNEVIANIRLDLANQIAHFEHDGRELEAARIKQRVEYDLEMIQELGYCPGIENYSRYFDRRLPGQRPFCLLDYFPKDMLMFIDESHVTIPQLRAMYGGDKARKINLVEYGFRLPAAQDNRPLRFDEFEMMHNTTVYVSATPGQYEFNISEDNIVEQFIRPTGVVDPPISIYIDINQIDHILEEIDICRKYNERLIITTITKRMAEEMADYLEKIGIPTRYIHSDVSTIDRVKIINSFRDGEFDILVGVNLLREGIDLPEVSRVIILDADKEGFLRNKNALTQIAGRAARHSQGNVSMYASKCTESLQITIEESLERCKRQILYNIKNKIFPKAATRKLEPMSQFGINEPKESPNSTAIYSTNESVVAIAADASAAYHTKEDIESRIATIDAELEQAIQRLDFHTAIRLRDERNELLEKHQKLESIS